jgi:hypothetical protein
MENTVIPENVIYPEILFAEDEATMVAWTRLRKRSNGIYYFWDYKQIHQCQPEDDRPSIKERLMTQLHFEIYMIQIMGKIDPKQRTVDKLPLFEKCASQTSEEKRLIERYQLNNQTN